MMEVDAGRGAIGNKVTYEAIAKFILENCSMGLIFDYDDATHYEYIVTALKYTPNELIYYLSDATSANQN